VDTLSQVPADKFSGLGRWISEREQSWKRL